MIFYANHVIIRFRFSNTFFFSFRLRFQYNHNTQIQGMRIILPKFVKAALYVIYDPPLWLFDRFYLFLGVEVWVCGLVWVSAFSIFGFLWSIRMVLRPQLSLLGWVPTSYSSRFLHGFFGNLVSIVLLYFIFHLQHFSTLSVHLNPCLAPLFCLVNFTSLSLSVSSTSVPHAGMDFKPLSFLFVWQTYLSIFCLRLLLPCMNAKWQEEIILSFQIFIL